MTSDDIRKRFLEFFAARDHRVVASSALIPHNDPTLLFTNAGMNQFKDLFLGREKRHYTRAASSQKCVRAGGKHNDLDNVGYTNRHLTFFEMLGNFSFGDYFKRDAIRFAWDLLVDGLELPADRLSATVYVEDDDAYDLWRDEIGLPEGRVSRLGKEDNFWAMGDTGPCGPCSEIYIDTERDGCGRAACAPGCDCGRYVEIWNLVFMQFERDAAGAVTPLPAPSIDTGMGLERISMALQGVESVYDTDLLRPILARAAAMAGTAIGAGGGTDVALRVIGDHVRSSTFLLADGTLPASLGRGYVLRRIIRRAARFGKRLGFDQPFLHELSGFVVERMGTAYPELAERREHIARVLREEEESFQRTLARSGREFDEIAAGLDERTEKTIAGADAFRLYSTHGLPLDTLKDMAEVRGLTVDEKGFARELEADRARGRGAWKGAAAESVSPVHLAVAERGGSTFVGYQRTELGETRVVAIVRDGREAPVVVAGEQAEVILSATPFYPQGGGQVGDQGVLRSATAFVVVDDTVQSVGGLIVHRVSVRQGELRSGDAVEATVEASRRRATAVNHSATHLLHAALRSVLGEHVKQAGSLVGPGRLRFDFTHHARPETAELARIEGLVNQQVGVNETVAAEVMPIDEALARGALAFFGDKYGDEVRVVKMGDFSTELCGGTHVGATGSIGYFRILSSNPVAAGVRRVEAVTGDIAVLRALDDQQVVEDLAGSLQVPRTALVEHVASLRDDLKAARRELKELKLQLAEAGAAGGTAAANDELREVNGIRVAVRRVEGLDRSAMRDLADRLRGQIKSGVVLLGTIGERNVASVLASVTPDLAQRIDAGVVVRAMAGVVGGRGGGRKDMAEAGGPDGERLAEALEKGVEVIGQRAAGEGAGA